MADSRVPRATNAEGKSGGLGFGVSTPVLLLVPAVVGTEVLSLSAMVVIIIRREKKQESSRQQLSVAV